MIKAWKPVLATLTLLFFPLCAQAAVEGRTTGEFLQDFTEIGWAIRSFATLFGVVLTGFGVHKFKKHSESPGQHTIAGAILAFVSGICLLSVPMLLNTFNATLFGAQFNPATEGAYLSIASAASASAPDVSVGSVNSNGVLVFVGFSMVVGLLYFVKGLFMIYEMGNSQASNPQTRNKAIMHIIGGAMAFNVSDFACVLTNTLGFNGLCT